MYTFCLIHTKGIAPATLEWLAHLVRTRILVVMPMTNAIGYAQKQRSVRT